MFRVREYLPINLPTEYLPRYSVRSSSWIRLSRRLYCFRYEEVVPRVPLRFPFRDPSSNPSRRPSRTQLGPLPPSTLFPFQSPWWLRSKSYRVMHVGLHLRKLLEFQLGFHSLAVLNLHLIGSPDASGDYESDPRTSKFISSGSWSMTGQIRLGWTGIQMSYIFFVKLCADQFSLPSIYAKIELRAGWHKSSPFIDYSVMTIYFLTIKWSCEIKNARFSRCSYIFCLVSLKSSTIPPTVRVVLWAFQKTA